MDKPPVLSIIVPVYNIEPYIGKCLESIRSQELTDIEIIVINDGSTDKSLERIQQIEREDSRIRVYTKPNGGLSSARNMGINYAKGELITFVDGDDWLSSDTYKVNVGIMKANIDIDMLSFPMIKKTDDLEHFLGKREPMTIIGSHDLIRAYFQSGVLTNSVCNKIFRRAVFYGILFPEGHTNEDTLIIPELVEVIKKTFISKIGAYFYYQRDGSIINSEVSIQKVTDDLNGRIGLYKIGEKYSVIDKNNICRIHLIFINNYRLFYKNNLQDEYKKKISGVRLRYFKDVILSDLNYRKKVLLTFYFVLGIRYLERIKVIKSKWL